MAGLQSLVLAQDAITWPAAVGVAGFVAIVMTAAGLAVVAVAARGADGRLGRSKVAGIRTRATLASDEAWLAAQKAGQPATRLGGLLSIATGVLSLLAAPVMAGLGIGDAETFMTVWAVLFGIGIVALLAAVLAGAVAGNRAAKAVGPPNPIG